MMTMFAFTGPICLKPLDISVILTDWVSWKVDSEMEISVQDFYERVPLEANTLRKEGKISKQ